MASRLRLNTRQIKFDLKTTGGMVDRAMVPVMTTFQMNARAGTPNRSGWMATQWDWERRAFSKGLGYCLGNKADYATYRMEGVKPKKVSEKSPMAVGWTQLGGNPWKSPTNKGVTWALYRNGYPGTDIFTPAMLKTASMMRLR